MQRTIDETNRRRDKQLTYNKEHGITPKQIKKQISNALAGERKENVTKNAYSEDNIQYPIACDPITEYMSHAQLEKSITRTRRLMEEAAAKMNFVGAAQYRDEMFKLQELLKRKEQ